MKVIYSKFFIFSFILHIFLLGFLIFSFDQKTVMPVISEHIASKEIIDAVAIDEHALNQEIARLDNIEKEKKRKQAERKRQQEKARLDAIKKRKAEEARLAKVKAEKLRLAKEAKAAKEAKLKFEHEQERKIKEAQEALAKIKKEKEEALKAKELAERERKKAEALAKKQEEERRIREAKAKAEQEKLEKVRQAQARQVTHDQIAQYAGLIRAKIHQNWRQPLGIDMAGKRCKLAVRLSETGNVLEASVVESSGNLEFDRSSEVAVMKSSPLPMPTDQGARSQFRKFTFTFNPEAV